jgi:hypothetical protein
VIDDDGSGARFAVSYAVLDPDGQPTLQVTPSGEALETKLALPFDGGWQAQQLTLTLYLPADTPVAPTRAFLGVAEVTGHWRWLDGVFAVGELVPGWNTLRFVLPPALRVLPERGRYVLYISLFAEDQRGKQPLEGPIYLGEVSVMAEFDTQAQRDPHYDAEAAALLALDDRALLEAVAKRTFDYFWQEADPKTGLVRDRSSPASPASIAAVGFGLSAIPAAIERGWISREEGYARALATLRSFAEGRVAGHRGFFYHFVTLDTGERVWESELSSIDTALLIAGALTVGQYFAGSEVAELAERLYAEVDWQWMMDGGPTMSMGWLPERGFLSSRWAHFDEGLLLYVLAIGSPSYPIATDAWDAVRRPVRDGYIYLPAETLFVYQYPLAWLDLRHLEDAYANYAVNAAKACARNRDFAIAHQERFATYRQDVWGLSASDGPFGYRAYGAAPGHHDGTVAPYAPLGCLPFTPELSLEALRGMLRRYGSLVWRRYGLISAINEDYGYYSREHIGIDQGIILLMIENHLSGLIWELFMASPHVKRALAQIGFQESSGSYAVTPAYARQFD